MNYDYLDTVAEAALSGDHSAVGVLSTGEQVYVGLAASSADILKDAGFTVVQAMLRLEQHELNELVQRWRHR